MADPLRHLDVELEALAARDLLRRPSPRGDDGLLDLCSNDYLGYAADPFHDEADARSGAGASRLVSGEDRAHEDAEGALATWLGTESALLFSSGYAANVGALSALARPGDVIVSDALNHASIIDGCRLSGAEIRVTPHRDTAAVAAALSRAVSTGARRWVVTESYFSMDGDSPTSRPCAPSATGTTPPSSSTRPTPSASSAPVARASAPPPASARTCSSAPPASRSASRARSSPAARASASGSGTGPAASSSPPA